MLRVLIVDDDRLTCWSISRTLEAEGYETLVAENASLAMEIFEEKEPDIVLLDYKLPECSGLELLKKMKSKNIDTLIAMMSAYGTIEIAVEAMKLGAFDYIVKPINIEELKVMFRKISEIISLQRTIELSNLSETQGVNSIIGESNEILKVKNLIKKIARTNSCVLITGETGTGKELVARALHYESPRRNKPFVVVNCSAIPSELFESELFGHEKGAFTGAVSSKRGLFELANRGTIFLDEIADLDLMTQAKLLRVIEERKCRRLGSSKLIELDIRIIAATNRNLPEFVKQKKFREDLFYRITTFTINLPPLRDRGYDIILLAKYFLKKFSKEYRKRFIDIDRSAEEILLNYNWKGNVRELKNLIERIVIMRDDPYLTRSHLIALWSELKSEDDRDTQERDEIMSLRDMELDLIKRALKKANNNKTKAAKLLGISRDVLRYKMKKYGL
jgi:two-component system response regulator AtoC